jgi:hypothetical protein
MSGSQTLSENEILLRKMKVLNLLMVLDWMQFIRFIPRNSLHRPVLVEMIPILLQVHKINDVIIFFHQIRARLFRRVHWNTNHEKWYIAYQVMKSENGNQIKDCKRLILHYLLHFYTKEAGEVEATVVWLDLRPSVVNIV